MNLNLTILAIETSLTSCSVALFYKNKIFTIFKHCPKKHEKNIINMITNILKKNNINIYEIDMIACTIGPGTFTGMRIAINTSYALSIVNNIPLLGFSSLEIIAEQVWQSYAINKVLIAIKISKNQILWGKFIKNKKKKWIGTHTEKKYKDMSIILNYVQKIKGLWATVGEIKNLHIKKKYTRKLIHTNIFTPHAKYILSYIQATWNKNYNFKIINNLYPKYMHNV